eukprot:jgi/Chlat1/3727/Chrsp259S03881
MSLQASLDASMPSLTVAIFFALLLCFAGVASANPLASEDDRLIGWLGETHKSPRLQGMNEGYQRPNVEVLSWKPRAFVYHNFLTDEECDHLVNLAKPQLQKSMVVDSSTGKSVPSDIRTSSGMFLSRGQDEMVTRIEKKIADWTMIPAEHGEGLQVLHYEIGQKYDAHFDWFNDKFNTRNGGQRIATVLMYLTDVEEGGETTFPTSTKSAEEASKHWSPCASRGVAAKPKKGDALLFWSMTLEGKEDHDSLHAGCPVIIGDKWSATKWMHVGPFGFGGGRRARAKDGPCEDLSDQCQAWAATGECEKNPGYMIGDDFSEGQCMKACKKCTKAPSL